MIYYDLLSEVALKIYRLQGIIELIGIYTGTVKEEMDKEITAIGGVFYDLEYGFCVIEIDAASINLLINVKNLIYVELAQILSLNDLQSDTESCIPQAKTNYGLDGEGILIGFVDSGIDYMHPAFIDENGETRIESIFDVERNKTWNKDEINLAIKSQDPFSIVDQQDIIGHGTAVAGVACAGGRIDKKYYGTANKSRIAMAKIVGTSSQLLRGIKFLIDKSKELDIPLVINLSFSTNNGAHDGTSLMEIYINTMTILERVTIVVAVGNEGDKAHHFGIVAMESVRFVLNIGEMQKRIILQLFKNPLADISISIRNPRYQMANSIILSRQVITSQIGSDKYIIVPNYPKPFSLSGQTVISLEPTNPASYVSQGEWEFKITSLNDNINNFDVWISTAENLNIGTVFLNPVVENTYGIPSTVEGVISVGSYNYNTMAISPFSGRGTWQNLKPDLVAPGEGIICPSPGGGFSINSGTSIAAPVVSGAAALLMQWGIMQKNDPFLYGTKIKYYLIKTASRLRGIEYPNISWGYGTLCLKDALDLLSGVTGYRNIYRNMYRQEIQEPKRLPDEFFDDKYSNFIINRKGVDIAELKRRGIIFELDENRVIASVKNENVLKRTFFQSGLGEIMIPEIEAFFTLIQTSPVDAANIRKYHTNPYLNLTGKGVIICFIDSGIDYLDDEFIYENRESKILEIWDQSEGKQSDDKNVLFGTIFTNSQINEAIALNDEGGNPYSIVASKDEVGHGTRSAKYASGRLMGAAPNSDIVMIKLREEMAPTLEIFGIYEVDVPVYNLVEVFLALEYVNTLVKKYNKPLVLCFGLGSNISGHNGDSLVERVLDIISMNRGVVCVTGVGNEGLSETHFLANLKETGDSAVIELSIDPTQKGMRMDIWCKKPDLISIGIATPKGDKVNKIEARKGRSEALNFAFEGAQVNVSYRLPEYHSGDESISLLFYNITPGVWKITVYGDFILNGRIDAWIYQKPLSKEQTKILNSDPFTTLTCPSTSRSSLSVAYYNQQTGSISSTSGKGYTRDGRIKPDISAGGFDIETNIISSSTATAVMAGSVALLLQWGIVNGNSPGMHANEVKSDIMEGAVRAPGISYPNPNNGYGRFDFDKMIESITSVSTGRSYYKFNDYLRQIPFIGNEENKEECLKKIIDKNYDTIIVWYLNNIDKINERFRDVCVFPIDEQYAAVTMPSDMMKEVISGTQDIIVTEPEMFFILNSISPQEAANIPKYHSKVGFNLTGNGVVVCIIDSGVDIYNDELIDEDGNSRILYAWDQTIDGRKELNGISVLFGAILTNEDINNEIRKGDKTSNTYLKEDYEHGTKSAILIGGNASGVAPKCKFIVIKLKPSNDRAFRKNNIPNKNLNIPVYSSTEIFLGIKFFQNMLNVVKMPMVVHIGLGSNTGGHSGNNIIEKQIDAYSLRDGMFFISGTGNEGDSDSHIMFDVYQGQETSIEVNVDERDSSLFINFWCTGLDKVSIGMISPLGELVNQIPKLGKGQTINFAYDDAVAEVYYNLYEKLSENQNIFVSIKDITPGVWTFNLYGISILEGKVNAWIPSKYVRNQKTRILNSTNNITLTIPSTAKYVLVNSYYNQETNGIIPESGRGYTRDGIIKPDVALGGYNSYTNIADSSTASSVFAGAIALIVEWGIVKGNDRLLNPINISNYLLRGAVKSNGRDYPNNIWGYGFFDMNNLFNTIGEVRKARNLSSTVNLYRMEDFL